jgi:2-C-methyl-D-erythritol 4-phosphate cytidylyltransferase
MSGGLKEAAEALRAAAGGLKNRNTCAVIVAAGSGSRMGSAVPKQFLELGGMPVVARTLRAYQNSDYITDIVVVRRPEDAGIYEEYAARFGLRKLRASVEGGATRQESVLRGVEAVPAKTAYVAIADAARPLVGTREIDLVCLAAYRYGAATAAYPSADTVKTADKGFIEETVDRSRVWLAATPQVFSLPVYRAAAYSCLEEGFAGTDDNSLAEHIGVRVRIVECSRRNFKITEPADLIAAEALLRNTAGDASAGSEEAT